MPSNLVEPGTAIEVGVPNAEAIFLMADVLTLPSRTILNEIVGNTLELIVVAVGQHHGRYVARKGAQDRQSVIGQVARVQIGLHQSQADQGRADWRQRELSSRDELRKDQEARLPL